MAFSTGKIINQRYRIVKSLSQGGFGRLYRAWDLSLKRPCAIKQNLEESQEGREQFETEALILADLHHPNLARVTDYFYVHDEGQFLVMDYVEGEDLQSMLDTRGPLQEGLAITWINQVCDALTFIHSQNPPIIHRDIKPANIRITPEGKAVLVDFGIAKTYTPDKITVTGARAVTPGFAPVEQYGSSRTDARTDVYAIGATLYTLLTGVEPPESINLAAGSPLPKLTSVNVQINPSVEAAVHTAMALQPEERYQSITALQAALEVDIKEPTRIKWLPKITIIAFGVLFLVDLLAIFSSYSQINIVSSIIQGDVVSTSEIFDSDRIQGTVIVIQLGVWILASAVFLVWIYFTGRYLKSVSQRFEYTPTWAALGCLVPFLNLVHPYQVVKQICESSDPQYTQGKAQGSSTSPRIIAIWWAFALLAVLFSITSFIFASGNLSLSQLRTAGFMFIVTYTVNAIAAGFTIFIIYKIDKMQEEIGRLYEVVSRTVLVE